MPNPEPASMTWTPLSDRLEQLPLILAGPILRRTEPEAVTVWVALKEASHVCLEIYGPEGGTKLGGLIGSGSRTTVALGAALHVVAVSAKPTGSLLEPGQIYAYTLKFGQDCHLEQALQTKGAAAGAKISYFDHRLPTFALPPADLNQLKILHGSCRKTHGGGRDALPILDSLIQHRATEANTRPHQLFLTGDQVYGDEVADPLLWLLTDAAETLLGWSEMLPLGKSHPPQRFAQLKTFKPGQRSQVARELGGLTAGLINKPEHAKSHLFGLGEYYAAYLLAWSPVLWPQNFPQGQAIDLPEQSRRQWNQKVAALQAFRHRLGKVRRSLANVPTYMIFDDHDISDDWYLNRAWCTGVLGKPLGRRVVQNGLLAYALFQAWGNTPQQFQPGHPGEKLLLAAQKWSVSAGTDAAAGAELGRYLGLPAPDPIAGSLFKLDQEVLILDRDPLALDWHYTVRSHNHEVVVLDTRTWRGYPPGPDAAMAPPRLLSPTAFKQQIQVPLAQTTPRQLTQAPPVTLVIAPTNLISLRIIDLVQTWDLQRGKVFGNDVGDAWNLNKVAFAQLLATLFAHRDRVVVLSGDIHYSYAAGLNYWTHPHSKNSGSHVLAQLTASPLKNAEWKAQLIHTKLKSVALEQPQDWVGWQHPPQLVEIQVIGGRQRQLTVEGPAAGPVIKEVQTVQGNSDLAWQLAIKDPDSEPDWRYQIQLARRGKARPLPWQDPLDNKTATSMGLRSWFESKFSLSWLWRNRWFQEGEEVVGQNNLGQVSFFRSGRLDQPLAVIQDLYWYCPWNSSQILVSRYRVSLSLKPPPPPLTVINLFLKKP